MGVPYRSTPVAKQKLRRNQRPDHPTLQLVQAPDRPRFTAPPPLKPQTEAQRRLLSSLRANTLTVSEGSAGTGKTYVALAYAAQLLQDRHIDRLVLTRPLVGVDDEDEKIGALPGDLKDKMYFWALPMVDILEERLGPSYVKDLIHLDRIRIAPMAFLRGSSYVDTFIHCTEAQNSTPSQLKMLLTRLGKGSRACVEGDTKQSDLHRENGLTDVIRRLDGMPDFGVIEFVRGDVVRSGFCQRVLERYGE